MAGTEDHLVREVRWGEFGWSRSCWMAHLEEVDRSHCVRHQGLKEVQSHRSIDHCDCPEVVCRSKQESVGQSQLCLRGLDEQEAKIDEMGH